MSDGNSTFNHRITRTCFRTCSTCLSRSQARLCLCTLWLISKQPERTFARLRYALGGDRPSQTAHQPLSPARLHGSELAPKHAKGGISTAPPPGPEPEVPRLPPILRMPHPDATAGYSKAPRGLFVRSWVGRVFTASTISPGSSLRQRPSRYAFRAGRNLPDKEFRYLRTVIVTAAVHRGFSSQLITAPFDLPAPGRRHPLYVSLRFCRELCFC